MRRGLTILFAVLLAVALSGMAYAAKDNEDTAEAAGEAAEETAPKTMNYGQCVSEHAKIRNTCYDTVKMAFETCKEQAAQDKATKKDAAKQCKQTYKNDKKQCKATFKSSKKDECAKIKHNFLETVGSALK